MIHWSSDNCKWKILVYANKDIQHYASTKCTIHIPTDVYLWRENWYYYPMHHHLHQGWEYNTDGTFRKYNVTKIINMFKWHLCHMMHQAPVPLSIFRSNSKFDENSKHSSVKYTRPVTTIFCTRHDSVTVVTCAKYRCDRLSIFETRAFWIFIKFRIRSKYA